MKNLLVFGILALGGWTPPYSTDESQTAQDGVTALEEALQRAADKALPAVVSIQVERISEDVENEIRRPFTLFGQRPDAPVSGTIIDAAGYVVTSYFNVSGEIKTIKVTLSDGKTVTAERLGYSKKYDVALLKVDSKNLPVLEHVPSSSLKVGQSILACGRSPDGQSPTVNAGIISAFNRNEGAFTQADVRINYGNVGGPVVDLQGRLIGITSNISTSKADWWGQNSGVSFVVNWEKLDMILPRLKEGQVEGGPAYLGVSPYVDLDQLKVQVLKGTPAEASGMKNGDTILEFDGKKIETFDMLREALDAKSSGDRVKIKVMRKDETLELKVKLGEKTS